MSSDDRLIVGLDFGTTFTGVAYAHSKTPDDVHIITSWPGPTEIAYTDQGIRWGSELEPEESRICCIKLFLDPNQTLPWFVSPRSVKGDLAAANKTVEQCAADYLSQVHKHTMETLTRKYGEAFITSTKIDRVLTVPAVWSDVAKTATVVAAQIAGFAENLRVISEPEAAACYTLKAIQPNHLKVGNNIVICDAGGGTCDLITYRITSLNPLRLKESAVGTGDVCGATFLNYRFEDLIKTRMGKTAFEVMIKSRPKTWQTSLHTFEEFVKRRFSMASRREFDIPMPGLADDPHAGLDSGFMALSTDQVRTIFDPIVAEVMRLIEGQVNAVREKGEAVSAILLVGGFDQSEYLYQRIQKHFTTNNPPPYSAFPSSSMPTPTDDAIPVMPPPNAWRAVVRGAILRDLEGSIVSQRLSCYHYGIVICPQFIPGVHPESSRYRDILDDIDRASDVMSRHVKKGSEVSEDRIISIACVQKWLGHSYPSNEDLHTSYPLIANAALSAPLMYEGSAAADSKRVCLLIADLTNVPLWRFVKGSNSKGHKYGSLGFDLTICIDSAHLAFSLRVGDVDCGSVKAIFNQ